MRGGWAADWAWLRVALGGWERWKGLRSAQRGFVGEGVVEEASSRVAALVAALFYVITRERSWIVAAALVLWLTRRLGVLM